MTRYIERNEIILFERKKGPTVKDEESVDMIVMS